MSSIRSSLSGSHSGSSASVHSITNTVTSTTALTAAYRPPPKDFAAAFANLQASYGMSGGFPAREIAPVKKKERKQAQSRAGPSNATRMHESSGGPSSRMKLTPTPTSPLVRHLTSSSEGVADAAEPPRETPSTGQELEEKGKASGVARLRKMLGLHKVNK